VARVNTDGGPGVAYASSSPAQLNILEDGSIGVITDVSGKSVRENNLKNNFIN
jgi:hypothetical protein